jgi:hypothetical protein
VLENATNDPCRVVGQEIAYLYAMITREDGRRRGHIDRRIDVEQTLHHVIVFSIGSSTRGHLVR